MSSQCADDDKLVTIRWETADGVRVMKGIRPGELLRSALLKRGVSPHNGMAQVINCRGLGTCGTCAVEVESGMLSPASQNDRERIRLSLPPHTHGSRLRLACQCRISSDLAIKKNAGFWGQNVGELAAVGQAMSSFGELEYVLDPRASDIVCGECRGEEFVLCPNCEGSGLLQSYPSRVTCSVCKGSGFAMCRSCFKGDPWDIEAVRTRAMRRPD